MTIKSTYFTLPANKDELKAQYYQLAKKHHPDANPNDLEAANAKMKAINVEYDQIVQREYNMRAPDF